ncbi:hypothetical protein HK104_005929 [Borealophlyctis nickersoniae]|nr:hypothetical protein HK104_005929 [Borealophlyctis nickersoniae]
MLDVPAQKIVEVPTLQLLSYLQRARRGSQVSVLLTEEVERLPDADPRKVRLHEDNEVPALDGHTLQPISTLKPTKLLLDGDNEVPAQDGQDSHTVVKSGGWDRVQQLWTKYVFLGWKDTRRWVNTLQSFVREPSLQADG